MNQPKFKMFDILKCKNGKIVTVRTIEAFAGNNYVYSDANHKAWENECELYQEPQKKKLYAYYEMGTTCNRIMFRVSDVYGLKAHRAPEYDLEYPDA